MINSGVLQEVEVNEAQLEDESVMTLFKLLTSGEKPDKCSKDGSDLFIYWCNFLDFRIFGKNVYRCHDKSEYGVHFQYAVPTSDDQFETKYKRQPLPRMQKMKTQNTQTLEGKRFNSRGHLSLLIEIAGSDKFVYEQAK
ncbi:hypothetical protein BpHYR1_013407 [Brachionus plicatilis]|uniref:Uncharacterized protein n=1 Tax=Brachionus plicatilis TaxID=10195 RepID=A0A3M7Q6U7_BRAPC|nr:hypothetical protein BpHYR1_013407 [Brachionus plicatilis]